MTAIASTASRTPAAAMSAFERYLTLWVFLCIVLGVALGQLAPGVFQAIGRLDVAAGICWGVLAH
jgi:ACR3 family arsenite transporter